MTETDEVQGSAASQPNDAGTTTYSVELTFQTTEGEVIEMKDGCSTGCEPEVGKEVRVSYRPSNPKKARNLDSGCSVLT